MILAFYSVFLKTSFLTKLLSLLKSTGVVSNFWTSNFFTLLFKLLKSKLNLVRKTDYNTKINEIENKTTNHSHDKYITTPEFNKLTEKILQQD